MQKKSLLELLRKAGKGRIKRVEYLRYLADVRAEEQRAWNLGYRITRKSIEEIREEFVRVSNFDSIYVNI